MIIYSQGNKLNIFKKEGIKNETNNIKRIKNNRFKEIKKS